MSAIGFQNDTDSNYNYYRTQLGSPLTHLCYEINIQKFVVSNEKCIQYSYLYMFCTKRGGNCLIARVCAE